MKRIHHHLLYAEDNPDDSLLVQRAFRKLGQPCSIIAVEDGASALAYLKGEGEFADRQTHPFPTLALLDVKMPRFSGLEVLEWIRQQPEFSSLPVVIFTSSRNVTDVRRAYDLGVNAYLVKSVEYKELQDTLHTFISFWLEKNVLPI